MGKFRNSHLPWPINTCGTNSLCSCKPLLNLSRKCIFRNLGQGELLMIFKMAALVYTKYGKCNTCNLEHSWVLMVTTVILNYVLAYMGLKSWNLNILPALGIWLRSLILQVNNTMLTFSEGNTVDNFTTLRLFSFVYNFFFCKPFHCIYSQFLEAAS